ncbi:MAG: VWA domain-containing protein, partial [Myxococcota bacterium]|nr:VWA domain-containing protein [Myxococcota bacterium]
MKAQRNKSYSLFAVLVTVVAFSFGGCMALNNTPLGDLLDFDLIGASPSEDGLVGFNVLPGSQFASFKGDGVRVEVKNSDGTYSPCDPVQTEEKEGSEFNSLALLLDDSGSMGRTYDASICSTCPHDPSKLRVSAVQALIDDVLIAGPQSRLSVMRFGPAPSDGWVATNVLWDFDSNADRLKESLSGVEGDQEYGTPLWDSLHEVITATKQEAETLEEVVLSMNIRDNKGEIPEVRRYIVLLSDGDDRPEYGGSKTQSLESVLEAAKANNVVIHAIGLGPASIAFSNPALQTEQDVEVQLETVSKLQRLAAETGGFYASVHDASALAQLYKAVAAAMTNGYQMEKYACRPDGEEPESGEKLEGRIL